MLRAIIGVIVGYALMAILVVITLYIAYSAMGSDGTFRPGTCEITLPWLLISLVLGLIAAIVGGLACAVIAEQPSKAPLVLAAIVLLLGAIMAIPAVSASADEPAKLRQGDLSFVQAREDAREPLSAVLLRPVVGCLGVLIGWRLRGPGDTSPKPLPANHDPQ